MDNAINFFIAGVLIFGFGLWLKYTIYWDFKKLPGLSTTMESIRQKHHRGERLSISETYSFYFEKIGEKVAKFSINVGAVLLTISIVLWVANKV